MDESSVGVVVIGRNEGERLRACLTSLQHVDARVYVDSGSTDGSCALARSFGFEIVELAIPPGFTAARARNAGVDRLLAQRPDLALVQTVDGDCEVRDGWLQMAHRDIAVDERRAVVFGRRRERRPGANAYHMATDHEWDVALGEVSSCGGDALFRVAALRDVGGYDGSLIAGEEPDLCLRLRQHGWRIWSNGGEMTWHDVAMDRFGQWWRRSRRTGFAIAELVLRHGREADPHWRRLLASALGWSAVVAVTLAIALGAVVTRWSWLIALAGVFVALLAIQLLRLAWQRRGAAHGPAEAIKWAGLIMAAKLAQAQGWLQFQLQRLSKRQTTLIEYKG